MNPRPPVDDAAIEPTRRLSPSNRKDRIEVLWWSVSAPLMFVRYVRRYMYLEDENTKFPGPIACLRDRREFAHWRQYNPAQWELVEIALMVGKALLCGLALLNAVFLIPLTGFTLVDVVWEAVLFTTLFIFLLAVQLLTGWVIAGWRGNVGYLLAAALPGGVVLGLMLLFALWVQHLPAYLDTASNAMLLVFLIWGYALGTVFNFFLAVAYRRANHLTFLLLVLIIVGLSFTGFLLTVRGVTLETYSKAWSGEHRFVVRAGLWWGIGFIWGVLHVGEWFIYQFRRLPKATDIPGNRAWSVPGSTQLPVLHLQNELNRWLRFDWQRGVNVVAGVAYVAPHEHLWATPLQKRLAAGDGADTTERMAAVYDSGIVRIGSVTRPKRPKQPKEQAAGGDEKQAPAKPKGQVRYQQETLLASGIGHSPAAPKAAMDDEQRTLQAAYWYYYQGYLFDAADILDKQKSAIGSSGQPVSEALTELNALVATFKVFLDLEAVSRVPTAALPPRPSMCRRTAAWETVDELVEGARWAWRARRSVGTERGIFVGFFSKLLNDLKENIAQRHLAERRLVLGIISVWERQIVPLLRPAAPAAQMPLITLRPWHQAYEALGNECPWQQASTLLCAQWTPGQTTIALIDGQPYAGVREAIEMAVARNRLHAVLVWCDVARWERSGVTFLDVCQFLCQEIGQELGVTDMIPDAVALRTQPLEVTCDAIYRMCRITADQCVVLALRNAEVFGRVLPPVTLSAIFDVLSQIEENVPNLALVLQTANKQQIRRLLARSRPTGLKTVTVNVQLLSASGVEAWLEQQFDKSGICFTNTGIEAAARLTGGHPKLLVVLCRCLRDLYNNRGNGAPLSPLVGWDTVYAAAAHTDFQQVVQIYCRKLARKLKHDKNERLRLLLYATAQRNTNVYTPLTIQDVQSVCSVYEPLTLDYIGRQYQDWVGSEVLDMMPTAFGTGYYLRCFAFAEWLVAQGHSKPQP